MLLSSLASSWKNDYFRAYAIIDFLANRLVSSNTVTYIYYIYINTIANLVPYTKHTVEK